MTHFVKTFGAVIAGNLATATVGFGTLTVYRRFVPREYLIKLHDPFENQNYVARVYSKYPIRILTINDLVKKAKEGNIPNRAIITSIKQV